MSLYNRQKYCLYELLVSAGSMGQLCVVGNASVHPVLPGGFVGYQHQHEFCI